jgi:hypothetical protein
MIIQDKLVKMALLLPAVTGLLAPVGMEMGNAGRLGYNFIDLVPFFFSRF